MNQEAQPVSKPQVAGLDFPEHEERASVLGELHARPLLPLSVPRQVFQYAFLTNEEEASADRQRIIEIARARGVPPPAADAKFHRFDFGAWELRWEQHTEFTTYMWATGTNADRPFERTLPLQEGEIKFVPPGRLLVAVNLHLVERRSRFEDVSKYFQLPALCVVSTSEGQGRVTTDFMVDTTGHTRFLIESNGLSDRRAGRLVQRVLEIETYRSLALLGLPIARKIAPDLGRMEREVWKITSEIAAAREHHESQALLQRIGELTADLEAQRAKTAFRFGATRAYFDIVKSRLEMIREKGVEDYVSISAFFDRRLVPAIDTCNAVEQRQGRPSLQLARTAELLQTGIQFDLEKQNRDLLRSMDKRARLQLRLQETVEGLSVAAISYYVVGLIAYLAKGLEDAGALPSLISPSAIIAVSVPVVIGGVWWLTQRVRKGFSDEDA